MNLKFPLLNLIARGHLPLANKTSTLNFAKNLDDGPATKICFEMLKFNNLKDSATFLEQAQTIFNKEKNSAPVVISEDAEFRHQRDAILLREDSNPRQEQQIESLNPTRQFIQLLKTGGWVVAVGWFASRTVEQKEEIMRSLKAVYPTVYDTLQNNWIGRASGLPNDKGALLSRVAKASIGRTKEDGSSWLSAQDKSRVKNYFGKIGKRVGIAGLIAGGIAGAIVSISLIYKRYFSTAAKACKNLSGKQRTICMTKARIKAAEAAIAESEKGLLECSSAKNEEDCMFKMKVEIRSWKKKKAAEEEKLRKLTNVNGAAFSDNNGKSNDPFL